MGGLSWWSYRTFGSLCQGFPIGKESAHELVVVSYIHTRGVIVSCVEPEENGGIQNSNSSRRAFARRIPELQI
jgi:hypothetical protein